MTVTTWPTEVRRDHEARLLRVLWQDGHRSDYEYDVLRGYCPCAMCQGHNAGPLRFQPPPRPVTAQTVSQVGNYALSIAWSDGHWTGIYRFDFLRSLCPCEECRERRSAAGAPTSPG
ncbi:MAG: DUF971 domain-containing protein [Holophagales bacterium]|nr:DUF971 domain-containing protein [Holophagales bacterium]MXX63359.1 DUF971 domain-containing protein [Holophagales bacterium]MYC10700.1 DUF971 domain-containing protein [Holophagales bacterium]MYD23371.1 DUF971 domain-containing protein [Holophagales bacterium]MYI34597.1 DUF971 domain-containing protein [Holophagales bacterium]